VIDSHCHLADAVFAGDLDQVIDRARTAGVAGALVIVAAGDPEEEAQAERLVSSWDLVRFSIGVHPHAAHAFADDPMRAALVVGEQLQRSHAARAIGEIGLDYHYDFSPRDVQQRVFRAQVRLARELVLPVVIHTREADEDTIAILREEGHGEVRGVLHCFTGTPALAQAALDLGFYLSVAGILTFPKAGPLRETVEDVPLERLLIETDSPFLAPVPRRGHRNEPSYLPFTAECLAAVQRRAVAEVDEVTTANFRTLFAP